MRTLRNWIVGVCLLFLFPVVLPFLVIWALVYKIPACIGGWIFDWLEMKDEPSN